MADDSDDSQKTEDPSGRKLSRARERGQVSADDILRAVNASEDADHPLLPHSALANDVVKPALVEAERSFSLALAGISVEAMAKRAGTLK